MYNCTVYISAYVTIYLLKWWITMILLIIGYCDVEYHDDDEDYVNYTHSDMIVMGMHI